MNSMEIIMNWNNQLPPIKRILAREKRLCYYCDEKHEPGHKCKRKQIFLLDGHESEVDVTCEVENNIKEDEKNEKNKIEKEQ